MDVDELERIRKEPVYSVEVVRIFKREGKRSFQIKNVCIKVIICSFRSLVDTVR